MTSFSGEDVFIMWFFCTMLLSNPYVHQLFAGEIDALQVHKAYESSYIKIYTSLSEYKEISWPDIIEQTSRFRQDLQWVIEELSDEIYFDEKIWNHRCVCFIHDGSQYAFITQWVSANLNFCELFAMKCTYRKQVSLVNHISQFQIHIQTR